MNSKAIAGESVIIVQVVQMMQHRIIEGAQDAEHLAVRLQLLQTELVEAAGRLNGVRVHLKLLAPDKADTVTVHLHDVLTEAAWLRKPTFDFKSWLPK